MNVDAFYYHPNFCENRDYSPSYSCYDGMKQSVISKHLGSASWISGSNGQPVQHLRYLPYGEHFINQRVTGLAYNERFTFTGKERDAETGYSYFGARYYDSGLPNIFLSVDPMSDKYPSISPYAYCAWNPVKLVDPDGREVINAHTRKVNDLKDRIANIQNQINNCTDKKQLRSLNKKLKESQSLLKIESNYEKIVNAAIQDLKNYGGNEFDCLDKLTSIKGANVDVYVQMLPDIGGVSRPLCGLTSAEIHSDGTVISNNIENTVHISVSYKFRNTAGATLAHEGGHVLFDVRNPVELLDFYNTHPNADRDGHSQGNPSGRYADQCEKEYLQRKKK